MKKRLFLLVLVLFSLQQMATAPSASAQHKPRIILVNPATGNLDSFIKMMKAKIIDIPGCELLVVCYAKTGRRFAAAESYVIAEGLEDKVKLKKIDGDLGPVNLFKENSCTKSFIELFNNSDGIVFFGGADFPPVIYGQKTNLLTNISTPDRHFFEISFLFHLTGGSQNPGYTPLLEKKPDYVILGFCLGMQSMNVAAGGSIYQDIPSDVYGLKYVEDVLKQDNNAHHRNYWTNLSTAKNLMWVNFHQITFENNALFADRLKMKDGETPVILSSHHQAINAIGSGYKVVARSMDGKIVEAIAHTKYKNVIGVQFHPEVFALYNENGRKYRLTPEGEVNVTYYSILNDRNGMDFHRRFWKFFSSHFTQ